MWRISFRTRNYVSRVRTLPNYSVFMFENRQKLNFSIFWSIIWRYFGLEIEILIFRNFFLTFLKIIGLSWNFVDLLALIYQSFSGTNQPSTIFLGAGINCTKCTQIDESPCTCVHFTAKNRKRAFSTGKWPVDERQQIHKVSA